MMYPFHDDPEAPEHSLSMSREEAVAVARDFVIREGLMGHAEPASVRLARAACFNGLFRRELYPCDFWVVEFLKVVDESPGSVMLEVIPDTGVIREIYVGMWADLIERSDTESSSPSDR